MFEKVSRSLKYDSNIFFVHKHIYIIVLVKYLRQLGSQLKFSGEVVPLVFSSECSNAEVEEARRQSEEVAFEPEITGK